MRDYWLTRELLSGLGFVYLIAFGIAIGLSLWLPKRKESKAVLTAVVILVAIGPIWQSVTRYRQARAAQEELQKRYAQAKAVFDERCKTAGEKIFRSVQGVTAVHLMRVRSPSSGESELDSNPFSDGTGEDYIRSFLLPESRTSSPRRLTYDRTAPSRPGFTAVTVVDDKDGLLYRYTLGSDYRLQREHTRDPKPTYAVTFDEPVIPADRRLWIASSVVRVVNQETGESLGEMTRFVMDPGLGSRAGQHTPWLFARGCGLSTRYDPNSTRLFASQVLQPYSAKD